MWRWIYDRLWSMCEWIYWNRLCRIDEAEFVEDTLSRGKYTVVPNVNAVGSGATVEVKNGAVISVTMLSSGGFKHGEKNDQTSTSV